MNKAVTRSREPYKGNKWDNQGNNLRKLEQAKNIFERGRKRGITNGLARGIIQNACD